MGVGARGRGLELALENSNLGKLLSSPPSPLLTSRTILPQLELVTQSCTRFTSAPLNTFTAEAPTTARASAQSTAG